MDSEVLLICVMVGVVFTDPQSHRTIVDLTKFNSNFTRPILDPSKPNITIGFLSSFKELGKKIAGAVPLAVDMVNEDPELLPDHNLLFIAYDSGAANTNWPIRKMTQMKDEGVAAFIGPDLSCEHEAMVAAAWDMPMISYIILQGAIMPTVQTKFSKAVEHICL